MAAACCEWMSRYADELSASEGPALTPPASRPVTLKHQAVSGGMWYGGSRFIAQGVSWASTIAVARALTPADYGLIGFALLVLQFADILSAQGLGLALVQKPDVDSLDLNTVFWSGILLYSAEYGLIFFGAPFVANFFGQPEVVTVVRWLGLALVIPAPRIISWNLLTRDINFKHRSAAEMVALHCGR